MGWETEPNLLQAVAHLPNGASLYQEDVSWDDYEQLLADLGDKTRVRVFYDNGKMEIMAPSKLHERPKTTISLFVYEMALELGIAVEAIGSTTLKRAFTDKGAEPDEAFYVADIGPALRAGELDLSQDAPPHLVVEVDRTSGSLNKFPIYAALGVPEIWRWQKGRMYFYRLVEGQYNGVTQSRAFPQLDAATLTVFINQGLREGQTQAAYALRHWLRAQN